MTEGASQESSLELASVEVPSASEPLDDETLDDLWSTSLGGAPEWDEDLLREVGPVQIASGDLNSGNLNSGELASADRGSGAASGDWDPTLAEGWNEEGWGLASSDSLALAYLDLGEDEALSEGD